MDHHKSSIYEEFSNEQLVGFYLFILTNIYSKNVSSAMFTEIVLLEEVAAKRGLELNHLKNVWRTKENYPVLVTVG
ncbi:hypothetical protein [Halobacillus campisalis]|uniref:Uncharacterized protein n=1 Tax=Halobacillus campisalis TaxID=435909 RepID=A0ABW2JZG7_9BACI|nr:hypothetical protein [Halobacillus campisalis]